jgi:hypothetical protein
MPSESNDWTPPLPEPNTAKGAVNRNSKKFCAESKIPNRKSKKCRHNYSGQTGRKFTVCLHIGTLKIRITYLITSLFSVHTIPVCACANLAFQINKSYSVDDAEGSKVHVVKGEEYCMMRALSKVVLNPGSEKRRHKLLHHSNHVLDSQVF